MADIKEVYKSSRSWLLRVLGLMLYIAEQCTQVKVAGFEGKW